MRITTPQPESSFLSVDKDINLIIDKMLNNDRLKKLLFHTTPDCLSKPVLTEEQTVGLIGKNIKVLPKLYVDTTVLNYVVIVFNNFLPNATNPEFRDNTIEFDVVCHINQWQLQNLQMRPYRIAAEIDSMVNNKKFTGIGEVKFRGGYVKVLSDEYCAICLMYNVIHGGEDKKRFLSPDDEQQFLQDFEESKHK